MSQFNFPRINFYGRCVLDPATGNNSWYLPLVIFNPISISCCLPPRVYLQEQFLMKGVTIEDIKRVLPAGLLIRQDNDFGPDGGSYIEIEPVDSEIHFKSWARIPLGEHEIDRNYHELYKLIYVPSNKKTLAGSVPGYWNFYGTMGFAYRNVQVTSIATGLNFKGETFLNRINGLPDFVAPIFGATLTMNTVLPDESTNSAVLVDLLPTMSMHTQIFTDKLTLFNGSDIIFSGKPVKASLRNINAFRVVNQNMPFGGSGIFYSVIPLEDLDQPASAILLSFFKYYGDPNRTLKGVFFRQVVSEIEEERNFDYRTNGNVPNPAIGTLTGSISPWYEGDMISWPGGRQLIGDAPYLKEKSEEYLAPVSMLTPCPFKVHLKHSLIQLDVLNNFPLINTADRAGLQQPSPYHKNQYETYHLGDLTFYLEAPEDTDQPGEKIPLETVCFSERKMARMDLYQRGGIIYIKAPRVDGILDKLKNWDLVAFTQDSNGQNLRVWKESSIIVTTDQPALYSNQGEDPARGYRVYSAERQPCILRIFKRGIPLTSLIDVSIFVFKTVESGSKKIIQFYRQETYRDGDHITFETTYPMNAIYLLCPYRTSKIPEHGYPAAMIQTGFFINHKVLPRHDYSAYFDPTHPEYKNEIPFDAVYKEVFRTYSLMAPTMDFREMRFANPFMAAELVKRTSLENWSYAWFMPVSRDLSDDQILLVKRWAQQFQTQEIDVPITPANSSDQHHAEHLKGKSFFQK